MKRTALLALALACCPAVASGNQPAVRRIEFCGNTFRSAGQLLRTMRPRWPGNAYNRDSLRAGLDRLSDFYRARGFPDIGFEYLVSPDSSGDRIDLTIYVREGGRYLVRTVDIMGNQRLDDGQLRRALRTRPGSPYEPAALSDDDFNLMLLYADHGMIFADVSHAVASDSGNDVRVTFIISEGDPVWVGAVNIAGNRSVRTGAIRRELTVAPGQLFSRRELNRSRSQLSATGLFKRAEVAPGSLSQDERNIDVDVVLQERPRRRFESGFGYGSGDAFRISSGWSNRNLDGWGRSLELSGQIAFQLWARAKLVRGSVQAGIRDPWFLGSRRSALLSSYYDDVRPAYTDYRLQTVGAFLQSSLFASRFAAMAAAWKQEWLKMSPDWGRPGNYADTLRYRGHRAVVLSGEYERTADPVSPVRGLRGDLNAEYSGGLLGGINTYQRLTVSAVALVGGTKAPLSLGARFRAGIIGDWSRENAVPVYEKYVLGGPATLRGFALGMAGPLDDLGRPVGGDKMALLNIEMRLRMYRNWRIALFGDAGLVSNRRFPKVSLQEASGNPGAGVRYVLPMGTARLDVAAPWTRAGCLRSWRAVVAWGEAF